MENEIYSTFCTCCAEYFTDSREGCRGCGHFLAAEEAAAEEENEY